MLGLCRIGIYYMSEAVDLNFCLSTHYRLARCIVNKTPNASSLATAYVKRLASYDVTGNPGIPCRLKTGHG